MQWISGTSFSLICRRPEEATRQENACLYSHPHGHSGFFNLKALCILIVVVRQKDRQVREHPCHSHTQRTTNKKVKPWGDRQMQNVRTMQEPTKIKGKKSTNRNSTSEIFEFDSEPVGADYRSALANRSARGHRVFVDNRSIVTKADEARFAVKWLALRAKQLLCKTAWINGVQRFLYLFWVMWIHCDSWRVTSAEVSMHVALCRALRVCTGIKCPPRGTKTKWLDFEK